MDWFAVYLFGGFIALTAWRIFTGMRLMHHAKVDALVCNCDYVFNETGRECGKFAKIFYHVKSPTLPHEIVEEFYSARCGDHQMPVDELGVELCDKEDYIAGVVHES